MCERARAGVKVRLLIDWLGNMMKTSPKFWRMLRQAGVEARSFGYPTIDSPLGWVSRDHRKSLIIDGRVAFVSGLCVGDDWTDDGHEAQRDTGVMIQGPAVADVEAAFAESWATTGSRCPLDELPAPNLIPPAGDVSLRVIATMPSTMGRLQARSAGGVGGARNVVGHRCVLRRRLRVYQRADRRRARTASTCGCWCPARSTCSASAR